MADGRIINPELAASYITAINEGDELTQRVHLTTVDVANQVGGTLAMQRDDTDSSAINQSVRELDSLRRQVKGDDPQHPKALHNLTGELAIDQRSFALGALTALIEASYGYVTQNERAERNRERAPFTAALEAVLRSREMGPAEMIEHLDGLVTAGKLDAGALFVGGLPVILATSLAELLSDGTIKRIEADEPGHFRYALKAS